MPNDSTSGFTDDQLQQITEIVEQATQSAANSTVGQVSDIVGSAQSLIVESVPSAVASTLDSRSGQTVALVGDQWDSLSGYVSLSSDSTKFENTLILLELMLVAIVIGVLFFTQFSRGFRR